MTYGFSDLGEPKIGRHDKRERLQTGSEESKGPTDTPRIEVDEVDPADFFDPEEFGYRRGDQHPSP